jgi:CRISPR-associated RAMP protein (TIGR02581 family)
MFKEARNLAKLTLCLAPEGPFLIKAREGLDPTRPDMEFVRLNTPYGEALYVPGSSLKEAVRATTEALLKSVGQLNPLICDPLDLREGACTSARNKQRKGIRRGDSLPYRDHCDACKTFGSTELAGRVRFGDLLPWHTKQNVEERQQAIQTLASHLNVRTGVAIDRRTGQAKGGALYEMETICGGDFYGEIAFQNIGLWQLGLLWLVLDRVDDGTLRLGFGKSRGLGRVRLTVERLTFEQFGPFARTSGTLHGADSNDEQLAVSVASTGGPLGRRFEFAAPELSAVHDGLLRLAEQRYM